MANSVGNYSLHNISEKVWQKVDFTQFRSFDSFLKIKKMGFFYNYSDNKIDFLGASMLNGTPGPRSWIVKFNIWEYKLTYHDRT